MAQPRVGARVGEKHQFGAAAATEADAVPMPQRPLGHLLVVHERAVARAAVLQQERAVVVAHDLRMLARHVDADRPQIALALPADAEDRLVDEDDPRAERIVHLKARRSDVGGFCHGHTGFAFSTPISIRNPVKSYTRRS